MRSRQGTFTSRGAPLVPTLPAPPWPWASANIISVSITPSAQECYAGLPWWLSGKDEQIQHTSLVSTSRLVGDRGGKQELLPAWVKIRPEWFQEAFFFFFSKDTFYGFEGRLPEDVSSNLRPKGWAMLAGKQWKLEEGRNLSMLEEERGTPDNIWCAHFYNLAIKIITSESLQFWL